MSFLNNGLYEPWIETRVANLKEQFGNDNIFRYMRYYKMFMSQYGWYFTIDGEEVDYSHLIQYERLFHSKIAFCKSPAYGLLVGTIADSDLKDAKRNPNGFITKVKVRFKDGTDKNCTVGKDCVIMESDSTGLPPFLYLYFIASKILEKEDIISQQDNMLRKPILVAGEGEELDNALNNLANVMSGVAGFNFNPKKGKGRGNILTEKSLEVLNLQVGNAYKGAELWDSRKNYEELICDYMGYVTVKNEKKERLNSLEVTKANSVASTFLKLTNELCDNAMKKIEKVLGIKGRLVKRTEEEVEDNGEDREMENSNDKTNDQNGD